MLFKKTFNSNYSIICSKTTKISSQKHCYLNNLQIFDYLIPFFV